MLNGCRAFSLLYMHAYMRVFAFACVFCAHRREKTTHIEMRVPSARHINAAEAILFFNASSCVTFNILLFTMCVCELLLYA